MLIGVAAVAANVILALCLSPPPDEPAATSNVFGVDTDRFALSDNTLVSADQTIRIDIPADWLLRDAESASDYVPAADFFPEVLTFEVATGLLVRMSRLTAFSRKARPEQHGAAMSSWQPIRTLSVQSADYPIWGLPSLAPSTWAARMRTMTSCCWATSISTATAR